MSNMLMTSVGAVYRLLDRPTAARRVMAALIVIHTLLLGYSAYVHSPTLNEPAHLVSGLSYWKFGRFDLYSVNPPLVKMVAALPVILVGYELDWGNFYDGPGARPEMMMGEAFLKANGGRSFFLVMIARWTCIPFSWLGMIVCYLWARDLFGRPSGVAAAAIWCFEPNILAHASLITPDAHATALGLATCYTFWRWLKRPTWSQAAVTGVVLGLAELSKTTLVLFYPIWPLMWIIYRWSNRKSMFARDWLREGTMLALRMAIGVYVLNLGYFFDGTFTRLGDYRFASDLFAGNGRGNDESEFANPRSGRRFDDTWLRALPVPFPKHYVLGIDIQQKDFEHYGRLSYLHGEWQEHGWWYYYLYGCAIKIPLALWMLGLIALLVICQSRTGSCDWQIGVTALPCRFNSDPDADRLDYVRVPRKSEGCAGMPVTTSHVDRTSAADISRRIRPSVDPDFIRDLFILLFPALVIFAVVSSKTGFSEHLRYVLPSFPFCFIFASGSCLTFSTRGVYCGLEGRKCLQPGFFSSCAATLVLVLGSWFIASTMSIYPHCLSYFNESVGGPLNGPNHLLGSNVDWGQDLKYLIQFLSTTNEGLEIQLTTLRSTDVVDIRIRNGYPYLSRTYNQTIKAPFLYATSANFVGECDIRPELREAFVLGERTSHLCDVINTSPLIMHTYAIRVFKVD